MKTIELTPNLKLEHIEENNTAGEELIAVCCFFDFYNKEGLAYILVDKLESEDADFAMIEGCDDLHDSFSAQLEESWKEIVKAVKSYHKKWKEKEAIF